MKGILECSCINEHTEPERLSNWPKTTQLKHMSCCLITSLRSVKSPLLLIPTPCLFFFFYCLFLCLFFLPIWEFITLWNGFLSKHLRCKSEVMFVGMGWKHFLQQKTQMMLQEGIKEAERRGVWCSVKLTHYVLSAGWDAFYWHAHKCICVSLCV